MFDLYNRARAEGSALLFAADAAPAQLGIELPDLRSRLGACTQFALKPLGDDERRDVLKAQAASRGIELDESVLDWLFARYARDLGALLDLLDRLDVASLAAQRRVTIPFLRGVLREAGPGRPDEPDAPTRRIGSLLCALAGLRLMDGPVSLRPPRRPAAPSPHR